MREQVKQFLIDWRGYTEQAAERMVTTWWRLIPDKELVTGECESVADLVLRTEFKDRTPPDSDFDPHWSPEDL